MVGLVQLLHLLIDLLEFAAHLLLNLLVVLADVGPVQLDSLVIL